METTELKETVGLADLGFCVKRYVFAYFRGCKKLYVFHVSKKFNWPGMVLEYVSSLKFTNKEPSKLEGIPPAVGHVVYDFSGEILEIVEIEPYKK